MELYTQGAGDNLAMMRAAMGKRTGNAARTRERLAAQAVRCWCGAAPGQRCRTTAKSLFPGTPTATHQSRVTGWRKLQRWEGR